MWSCKKSCYCEKDKTFLVYPEWHLRIVLLMIYEVWLLTPLPLAGLWAHYLFSFVNMLGRHVCDLQSVQLYAKCTLERLCDECNKFFPSDLGCGFILPLQRKKRSLWYISHTLATLPFHFSFHFFFLRGEELLSVLPFILWANSVVLFYDLGLWAASALSTSPWTVRLMRKAKWHQVKGSGSCCGEKLGMMNHQEQ